MTCLTPTPSARPSLLVLPVAVALALQTAGAYAQSPGRVVDDALLRDPPTDEWVTYGRDYAETHYSPLDQITTAQRGPPGARLGPDRATGAVADPL